jgi:hypothetical protein
LTSRYISIHTGFTDGLARHIVSASFTFHPTIDETNTCSILECIIENVHVTKLGQIFPHANFLTHNEDFRTYRPRVARNPGRLGFGGFGLSGLLQGVCAHIKGYGLIKLATGACVGAIPGTMLIVLAGGLVSGGVYLYSTHGADTVCLFSSDGRVEQLKEQHRAALHESFKWKIGKRSR